MIEVDFEVFKALTIQRATETVSYNDVLRSMLKLSPSAAKSPDEQQGWTWKGVTLPDGTELRAEYKGKVHTAKVMDGQWMQDGKSHGSPSAAAHAVTGSGVNGWWFWEVKRPGDTVWGALGKLRHED